MLTARRFSAYAELVLLKSEGNAVTYALTLRKDPDAGYLWEAYFLTPGTEPGAPTVSIEFDEKVAFRFLTALNYRLSRWVTVVEKSHAPGHYEGAWWIYYRVANGAVSALIDAADFQRNPAGAKFAHVFIHAPQRLLTSESAERNAILTEIEARCTDILHEDSSK